MKLIPSYGKILTLGSAYTENALKGEVTIQEKVDGSQFAWGLLDDGELSCRSKGAFIQLDSPPKMFKKAVDHIVKMANKGAFKDIPNGSYFYGETLESPKHNTLSYGKTPLNNIVLFDAIIAGKFISRSDLDAYSKLFEVDVVPELYSGVCDVSKIKELLTTKSYLGNEIIEGVVIKNYSETFLLGGQVMPMFTKFVREEFKERHSIDWKTRTPKGNLTSFLASFKAIPRWTKALLYLRDQGKITQEPKDIGPLIKRVQEDILGEEKDNIKNELYRIYIDDILRTAVAGLPQWYKNELLNNVK